MDLSKKLAALREERAKLIADQRALLEKAETETRDLTDVEDAEYITHGKRAADLEKDIARIEALIEDERKLKTRKVEDGDSRTDRDPYGSTEVRVRYSKRSIDALGGAKAEPAAFRMGMWARSILFGDQRAHSWCVDHGIDMRAASEGVYSKGGALVPEEMANFIIDLREEYGLARQLLRIVPMGSDTLTIPRRVGGVTAYFVGEGQNFTDSDKSWDGVTLSAKKLGALSKMSLEYAEDAVIDVAADLAMEQAYAFGVKEDDCWLNGDGTSTYGGIVGLRTKIINGSYTQGAIDAASGHDTFAEVDADDLNVLIGRLPRFAAARARWLISQMGKALVFDALAVAAGGNTIMTVGERPRPTYLGTPVEVSQAMPAVTTAQNGTAMLLYGDFSLASTMGDRRGFTMQVLRELYAASGHVGVLGFERFDIVNHDLGSTTVAGPVVALIGKT